MAVICSFTEPEIHRECSHARSVGGKLAHQKRINDLKTDRIPILDDRRDNGRLIFLPLVLYSVDRIQKRMRLQEQMITASYLYRQREREKRLQERMTEPAKTTPPGLLQQPPLDSHQDLLLAPASSSRLDSSSPFKKSIQIVLLSKYTLKFPAIPPVGDSCRLPQLSLGSLVRAVFVLVHTSRRRYSLLTRARRRRFCPYDEIHISLRRI